MIRKCDADQFWEDNPSLMDKRGVYVFGIRTGRAIVPTYVGKTEGTFGGEALEPHKRSDHYNEALHTYERGTPVLFFLVYPTQAGALNKTAIDDLETALIAECVRVNPDGMTNMRKKPQIPSWSIQGVFRTRGRPTESADDLRTMLKL